MGYLDELRSRSFVATDEAPGGLVEYDCELYPGTERELTIQCYTPDMGALTRDVVPVGVWRHLRRLVTVVGTLGDGIPPGVVA